MNIAFLQVGQQANLLTPALPLAQAVEQFLESVPFQIAPIAMLPRQELAALLEISQSIHRAD